MNPPRIAGELRRYIAHVGRRGRPVPVDGVDLDRLARTRMLDVLPDGGLAFEGQPVTVHRGELLDTPIRAERFMVALAARIRDLDR